MAFSFDNLAEELGARRRRLRRALKPWRAALVEFALFGGIVLGLAGPLLLGRGVAWWYGLAPLALLILGYVGLDMARQRQTDAQGHRGRDLAALGLICACAGLGFAIYAAAVGTSSALPSPPPAPAESGFLPAETPDALETEIVN
jgi:hypothetical protein